MLVFLAQQRSFFDGHLKRSVISALPERKTITKHVLELKVAFSSERTIVLLYGAVKETINPVRVESVHLGPLYELRC